MNVRYYIDRETGVPHIYGHDVSEPEVEEVLERAVEDYSGVRVLGSLTAVSFGI